ncbi:hypothetical protein RKD51_001881 [Bacillus sp. SLBN-57]
MGRMIALLVLLIPGGLAALGIKLMRDTVFGILIGPLSDPLASGAGGVHMLRRRPLFVRRIYSIQRQKTQPSKPPFQKKAERPRGVISVNKKKPQTISAAFCISHLGL